MTLITRKRNTLPSVWDDLLNNNFFSPSQFANTKRTIPAVNIRNTPENYAIELAAPGMKKEDFKINVDGNLLTVSSEAESTASNDEENYTRKEYSYHSFERTFTLPDEANSDEISAKYIDGVLGIAVAKKEEAKAKPARTIAIA